MILAALPVVDPPWWQLVTEEPKKYSQFVSSRSDKRQMPQIQPSAMKVQVWVHSTLIGIRGKPPDPLGAVTLMHYRFLFRLHVLKRWDICPLDSDK